MVQVCCVGALPFVGGSSVECLLRTKQISLGNVPGHLTNSSMLNQVRTHHDSVLVHAQTGDVGYNSFSSTESGQDWLSCKKREETRVTLDDSWHPCS